MTANTILPQILITARDILKENKNKPLHVNEIAEIAVKSARNQTMTADVFAAKLSGALSSHLKIKTSKPIFTKPLNKQGKPQKGIYLSNSVQYFPLISVQLFPLFQLSEGDFYAA